MTVAATVALSDSSVSTPTRVVATLTINQNAATPLLVTAVVPRVVPQNLTSQSVAVGVGTVPLGGAFNCTVPATGDGDLLLSFGLTPNAPTTDTGTYVAQQGTQVYTVGALVYTNDGQVISATTTNLTVSSLIPEGGL